MNMLTMLTRIAGMLAVSLLLLGPAPPAWAQQSVLCVTPTLVCRAVYAGPKGAPCSCKTYAGWVRGRLG